MTADLRVVLAEMRERAEGVNAYATTDLPALLDAVEAVLGVVDEWEQVNEEDRAEITYPQYNATRQFVATVRDAITDALGGTA